MEENMQGRGIVSNTGGITSKTVETTHKKGQGEEPVRFKPGSVHRRTEPVEKSIKGFVGFSKSFLTLVSLSKPKMALTSLYFFKTFSGNKNKNTAAHLHLLRRA